MSEFRPQPIDTASEHKRKSLSAARVRRVVGSAMLLAATQLVAAGALAFGQVASHTFTSDDGYGFVPGIPPCVGQLTGVSISAMRSDTGRRVRLWNRDEMPQADVASRTDTFYLRVNANGHDIQIGDPQDFSTDPLELPPYFGTCHAQFPCLCPSVAEAVQVVSIDMFGQGVPVNLSFFSTEEVYIVAALAGGGSTFTTDPADAVTPCSTVTSGAVYWSVTVTYTYIPADPDCDCDDNGVYDNTEMSLDWTLDCNQNGILDLCDIAEGDSSDGNGDRIPDECQGYVVWEGTEPLLGARIESYYWTASSGVSRLGLDETESGIGGEFIIPRSFWNEPLQAGELGRSVRAVYEYEETISDSPQQNTTRSIVNYLDWKPRTPIAGRGLSTRRIIFPYPVVFQPGVMGHAASASGLRDFLVLDPGDPFVLGEGETKRQHRIPAFVFFSMPSAPSEVPFIPSDGVSWGYLNNPLNITPEKISENAVRLQNFILNKIRPQLEECTPAVYGMRMNVLAHSYGGIITRRWIKTGFAWPRLARYVTFDSPHGGTSPKANDLFRSTGLFLGEPTMNGIAETANAPPTEPGWNSRHSLFETYPASTKALLLASTSPAGFDIIDPHHSAWGIGRTQIKRDALEPNGHCSRWIGGWELGVPGRGHSIQSAPEAYISAARFLATGNRPAIGTIQDPGAQTTVAVSSGAPESTPGADCLVSSFGPVRPRTATYEIDVLAQQQSTEPLLMDTSGLAQVRVYLTDSTAMLSTRDAIGMELPRFNTIVDTDVFVAGDQVISFELQTFAEAGAIELTGGTNDAVAFVNIEFTDGPHAIVEADSSSYRPGTLAQITARLEDELDQIVVGIGGTGELTVLAPDGTLSTQTMLDDGLSGDGAAGDGVYGVSLFGLTSGLYRLGADLAIDLGAGVISNRESSTTFQVDSTAASLTTFLGNRLVDDDMNGLAEYLALDFQVNATELTSLQLLGTVSRSTEDLLSVSVFADVLTVPDTLTLTLSIPGTFFHRNGPNWNYDLTGIQLWDDTASFELGDLADFAIPAARISAFELPPAPRIDLVLPDRDPMTQDREILILGTGFEDTTAVQVGNGRVLFEVFGDGTIVATPPRYLPRQPVSLNGSGSSTVVSNIRVITPWGEDTIEGAYPFNR